MVNSLIKHTNENAAKGVFCIKCQICFNNSYLTHMHIRICVRIGELVMHAAAAKWVRSIIPGNRKKKEMKKEWRERGRKR